MDELGFDDAVRNKKTPARGGRQVVEAGFIQARNLSSSDLFIGVLEALRQP